MSYVYIYRIPMNIKSVQYSGRKYIAGDPFYVGKGTKDRFKAHIKEAVKFRNRKQKNVNRLKIGLILRILDRGIEPEIEIFRDNISDELALKLEIELILGFGKLIDHTGMLTNLTDGGDGGNTIQLLSDEQKKKRSQKISKAMKVRAQTKKHKQQATKNMLKAARDRKGKPWSKVRRLAYENGKKSQPKDANEKRSKALKGRKTSTGMFGKKHSSKTKKKMANSIRNQTKYECMYCKKMFMKGHLTRWHNENCKGK